MSGGTNDRAQGGLSGARKALAVVALLVVATVAPSVGVSVASHGGSSAAPSATAAAEILQNPLNGTDDGTNDSDEDPLPTIDDPTLTTVDGPLPTTVDDPITTIDDPISTTEDEPSTTTAEAPDATTVEKSTTEASRTTAETPTTEESPSPPGDGDEPPDDGPGNGPPDDIPGDGPPDDVPGDGPPDDVPGANRTPNGPPDWVPGGPPGIGDRPVGPPNTTWPPGLGDGPSNPSDGGDGPPANRTGPGRGSGALPNETGPPNGTEFPGNRTGPPNGTPGDGPPGNGTPNVTRVNVTVENASANESASVNVSRADDEGDVSFSTIDVTPTRNASFTLNVTASEDPIPAKTPSVELSNGTRPLAYLSVDHSIADENISNVTFTFRVRRDRVNDSERHEIALYRFHDEEWNELPTTLVETTDDHYVYRVRSPGLSEFAAGKQTAEFEIANASVEVDALSVGDALRVRVRVVNRGQADGTFTAELALGDRPVADRRLTIASGGMRQTTFERTVERPGTYGVWVNDVRVGEVTVNGTATGDDSTATDGPDEARHGSERTDGSDSANGTNANVPGFGAAAAVATLFALLALLAARRRV